MNNRDRTVVGKVLDEIAIAESLMQNEDLASFLEDEKLKRAVCMTVINIGELVKNLTESFRLIHAQVPWKAIAGFRDIAAHKYQTLRMEDVYATVSDDFPSLRTMLEATRNAQVATVRHPTLALGDGARASRLAADARRVLLRLA